MQNDALLTQRKCIKANLNETTENKQTINAPVPIKVDFISRANIFESHALSQSLDSRKPFIDHYISAC